MHRWAHALVWLCLLQSVGCNGCGKDDGTTPIGKEELPALRLTDQTPDLLLTWFDDRGRTHTGVSLGEVPEGSRRHVRVITQDAGHGEQLYVADLTRKADDGSYAVRIMDRSKWEAMIAERRAKHVARLAPPPRPAPGQPPAAPNHPPLPDHADPSDPATGVRAIVYGASWCKPCHQAAGFLKRRGAKVTEYDIEKEPARQKEMHQKLSRAGRRGGSIPIIDIEGTILVGFNPGAIDRVLSKAKKGTAL